MFGPDIKFPKYKMFNCWNSGTWPKEAGIRMSDVQVNRFYFKPRAGGGRTGLILGHS